MATDSKPTTWDEAARTALHHVLAWQHSPETVYSEFEEPAQILEYMQDVMADCLAGMKVAPPEYHGAYVLPTTSAMANLAYRWLVVDDTDVDLETPLTWLRSQRKHEGHEGLTAFGYHGLLVRAYDVLQSIGHLHNYGRRPSEAPYLKKYLYNLIEFAAEADLLHHGWAKLPLLSEIQLERSPEFVPKRGAGTDAEKEVAAMVDAAMTPGMTVYEKWLKRMYEEIPADKWPGMAEVCGAIDQLIELGADPDTTRMEFYDLTEAVGAEE